MEVLKTQYRGYWYRLIVPSTCLAGGCIYELYKESEYVKSFPTVTDAKEYLQTI